MKPKFKSVSKNTYTEFKPPASLKDISIKGFKFTCIPDIGQNVNFFLSPSYTTEIIFLNFKSAGNPGIFIKGPHTIPLLINAEEETFLISIKFRPLVLPAMLDFKTSLIVNKLAKIDSVVSETDVILINNLMKKYKNGFVRAISDFFSRKDSDYSLDEKIKRSIDIILRTEGNIKLNELYDKIKINKRTFQRIFKLNTGLTAKDFCKLARFESVSRKLVRNSENNFDVIFEGGFFDQAHFTKEFKQFAGLPPSEYKIRQKTISYKNLI